MCRPVATTDEQAWFIPVQGNPTNAIGFLNSIHVTCSNKLHLVHSFDTWHNKFIIIYILHPSSSCPLDILLHRETALSNDEWHHRLKMGNRIFPSHYKIIIVTLKLQLVWAVYNIQKRWYLCSKGVKATKPKSPGPSCLDNAIKWKNVNKTNHSSDLSSA